MNPDFLDVEGVPVSIGMGVPPSFVPAWGTLPPRPFDHRSARRNGSAISDEEFWRMAREAVSVSSNDESLRSHIPA